MRNTTIHLAAVSAVCLALQLDSSAQVTFTNSLFELESLAAGAGKFVKGTEDFEESVILPFAAGVMNDPLDTNTDNEYFNPGFIEPNLRIQSNTLGQFANSVSPFGTNALAMFGQGSMALAESKSVGVNLTEHSLDLIFLTQDKTAVSFEFAALETGVSEATVAVYDIFGTHMASTSAFGSGWVYCGVFSSFRPIGRINIFMTTGEHWSVDEIEMWTAVPEPSTFVVAGLGIVFLALRRRS